MKKLSILLISTILSFALTNNVQAQDVWVNDARDIFLKNSATIYEINIRTFNAQDLNGNGIIDFDEGEESGNFLNAIERLDELAAAGINTIHVMPVMEVGKTKALGTAGSLYAASSFTKLNPQLGSNRTALSIEKQAEKFINEAHRRRIRVIFDMPGCGAYDLFLKNPELFVKDSTGQPIIPSDWTDVRLFNSGINNNVSREVYNLYRDYVDYVLKLGVDGIRADVATSKPESFWKELIAYSRRQDPKFLWLAEASESWNEPISKHAVFTPYDKLLEAGFDGYYGSFMNVKNFTTGSELMKLVDSSIKLKNRFSTPKSVIGSFSTHDELSPMLVGGQAFTEMTFWMNAVLPVNFYTVDGIPSGDNYVYFWANKKAPKSYTDDDYYFAHRGKIDIFNFSKKPGGKNMELRKSFTRAVKLKYYMANIYNSPNFKFSELKTSSPETYAFSVTDGQKTIVVFGNITSKILMGNTVTIPKFTENETVVPIQLKNIPEFDNGKLKTTLAPYEIQVIAIDKFGI